MIILKGLIEYIKENGIIITCTIILSLLLSNILIIGLDYNKKLIEKINEYEKILKTEYGQKFESYNEYLVFKIEKGNNNEI